MSQKNFLSDNEVSEQVYKYYNLKLDRDALTRPTKELVIEVYKRFLDKNVPNWMNGPVTNISMFRWMRRITQNFNLGHEFGMIDLIAPTKKRTLAFFNVILYVQAVHDECLEIDESYENRKAEQRDKNAMMSSEISKLRIKIEQLAFKIGQSGSADQLRAQREDLERVLRAKKKDCDEADKEKSEIKQILAEKSEMHARQCIEIEEHKRKVDEHLKRETIVSEQSKVQEKLATVEAALQQLKIQKDIKRTRENHELRLLLDEEEKLVREQNERNKNFQNESRKNNQVLQESKKKTADDIKMTDDSLRQADQLLEELKTNHYEEQERLASIMKSISHDYKINLNSVFGVDEETITAKNSTFIKSKNIK